MASYDLDAGEMVDTAVYHADDLVPGVILSGPAIIEAPTTTILIGAGDRVTVDPDFGLSVEVRLRQRVPELA